MCILHHRSKGYSLPELLVSLAVIGFIVSIVIFSYSQFNDSLALSSAAQEMAVSIRQAQSYGISVKERVVGNNDFNSGYGVYVSTTDTQNYYIFSDNGASTGKYDGGSACGSTGDCQVEKITLRDGVRITSICGTPFSGTSACPPSAGLLSLHVTFLRPSTNANIRFTDGSYGSLTGLYQTGKIVLTSPKGRTANVIIENTGQISVQ